MTLTLYENNIKLIQKMRGIIWQELNEKGKNSYFLEYLYEGERYSQTIKANSPSEADRKLALPFKTMVYISFCTGARRGEVLALRWKDVDFDNNIINIVQNKIQKVDNIQQSKQRRFDI